VRIKGGGGGWGSEDVWLLFHSDMNCCHEEGL